MKTAVVVFSDEISRANSLLMQAPALSEEDLCEVWVLGGLCGYPHNRALSAPKITEILLSNTDSLSEPLCCAEAVYKNYLANSVDIIIFPSDIRGSDLAARVCSEIGCEGLLGAKELLCSDGELYINKPVYSNNLQASFRVQSLPLVLSMVTAESVTTPNIFDHPELTQFGVETSIPSWLTDIENESFENGDLLKCSSLVLAAGRGVGKAENFAKLTELAQKMGGVLGGTRPTVCDGKMPPERMIGMSAAVLSPDCCIVFGASGAAPFLAGVEKSKLLIAVNRDPNALIFDNCDVGIIEDCNEFADALSEQFRS